MNFRIFWGMAALGMTVLSWAGEEFNLEEFLLKDSDTVVIDRLPLQIKSARLGFGDAAPEEEKTLLYPPQIKNELLSHAGFNRFQATRVLESNAVTFPMAPFVRFSPQKTGHIQNWEASIINSYGDSIYHWSGNGSPPIPLVWDGLDEGWINLKPGQPYSLSFTASTQSGEVVKETSSPFEFPFFQMKLPDRITLLFSPEALIDPNPKMTLSPEGEPRLMAAAEIISRHPGKPISLEVFSRDFTEGTQTGNLIRAALSKVLLIPPQIIALDINVEPGDPEEIRISVLGTSL